LSEPAFEVPRVALGKALVLAARFVVTAWARLWIGLVATSALLAWALARGAPAWIWPLAGFAAIWLLAELYALALVAKGAPDSKARPTMMKRIFSAARLLASLALVAVLTAIVGALLSIGVLAVAFGVAAAGAGFVAGDPATWAAAVDGRGRIVIGLAGAAAGAALAWVLVRLAYAAVATIARARVQALSAWPISRGVTLKTAAGLAVVTLPVFAALLVLAAARPVAGALLAGLLIAGLALPLNAGLMTYLYRQITEDSPDA
jgi:hypothetical protein